ncbi:MAG: hypothetical protein ACKVOU_09035 [Cytophagales bacterium]
MTSYKNPSDPENIFLKTKLNEWLKAKLGVEQEIVVDFKEIPCGVDNCPCTTTEILISKPFYQRFTLGKPLVYIRKWDIERLEI